MTSAPKAESVRIFSGYKGGEEMPLGGYTVLLSLYLATVGGALAARRKEVPEALRGSDLLLTGVATHKLARIVTKDWVTSPLRAPFTTYKGSAGSGEVRETSRGKGVRRALGDLLTCPFCIGPWIAGSLAVSWTLAPRLTRTFVRTFTVVAISDFLHQTYSLLHAKVRS